MNEKLEEQAACLDRIIGELEKALAHAKIAGAHFRDGEVPRACAHTFAVEGHVVVVTENLQLMAKTHRLKAKI